VGVALLQEQIIPIARWLSVTFGWIPFLAVTGANPDNPLDSETIYKSSTFVAGIVVSLMIMPIICSVMREAFSQAPLGEREGAYALGATRWGVVRLAIRLAHRRLRARPLRLMRHRRASVTGTKHH
jgi:phosphate transport system permease protein